MECKFNLFKCISKLGTCFYFPFFFSSGLLYKGSLDCLFKTVENEGFLALYKGFLPVWIRMAPWSLTFWMSFEQIRHMLGATGF